MDHRLRGYYNRELQHLREMSGEFAREYPKIAGRLSLDEFACADPYVERLLEGFAFMAARVQLKFDAEFPRFTQAILETVYPHYLAPTPSMAVVQFQPDMSGGTPPEGYRIARGESIQSLQAKGDRTATEYRTGRDVMLWPVEVKTAAYYTRELSTLDLPPGRAARAAVRLVLGTPPSVPFSALPLDELTFFLRGADQLPMRLYEQLFAHATAVIVRPTARPHAWQHVLERSSLRQVGFDDDEALLPVEARTFQGYRLLHEYFAFPQRFLFFAIRGLAEAIHRVGAQELELIVLFDEEELELEDRVDAANFALHCTPVVNLFPKRTDRIQLSDRFAEFHVVADRTRPRDFEIYQVQRVTGYGIRSDEEQKFSPFYASSDFDERDKGGGAYFSVNRVTRMPSAKERQFGRRSSYIGSEVFISLVDAKDAPYSSDLRELGVESLCTNRDLPLHIPLGRSTTDFNLDVSAPVVACRCVSGPTPPCPSYAEGEIAWRAISHLTLNYLSLVNTNEREGASALRDLLKLYGNAEDRQIRKQIDGVLSVGSRPVTRRVTTGGPIAFARGLSIALELDESAFEGTGVFLLGAVMERFFAKYVSINSFTETVIRTRERGEIMRWPARVGIRQLL